MKKETLCIRNFSIDDSKMVNLNDISLSLMEGEITGFLGLDNSGRNTLLQVLYGNEWSEKGEIFIDGIRITMPEKLKQNVHRIMDINYAIADWTVAEYIGLVTERFWPIGLGEKKLSGEIRELFSELQLNIDVDKKLGELSELDKRIVDLAKAYRKQTKILIIDDVFDGFTFDDLIYFKTVLNGVINGRMTVIICMSSDNLNQILSDYYVVFYKGMIIKKCPKDAVKDRHQLDELILGSSGISKKTGMTSSVSGDFTRFEAAYAVKSSALVDGRLIDFSFGKGEIVTLLDMRKKEKTYLFNILSGRTIDRRFDFFLDGKKRNLSQMTDFVKNKIVSSAHLGGYDELLPKMSVGENILLPSLNKIPSLTYIRSGSQMLKMLEKQAEDGLGVFTKNITINKNNDRILILLERWYMYKPKVILLMEPFIQCDGNGVSLIKAYIDKYASMGTVIIIVKARENDIDDISHRIIDLT